MASFSIRYGLILILTLFIHCGYAQSGKVRVRLEYYMNNGEVYLVSKATARSGRRYEPVSGLSMTLFLSNENPDNRLGKITTDEKGSGTLDMPPRYYQMIDSMDTFHFIARLSDTSDYEDPKISLTIYKSALTMDLESTDTLGRIKARLTQITDSGSMPVPNIQLKFYVQRLFSQLPFGGDYTMTDETGYTTIEFPGDIPGDVQGNVEIICKVLDDEKFGNLSVSKIINWGQALHQQKAKERTMWSGRSKPPMILLIFPNVALAVVWGYIVYLLIVLTKIKSIGKNQQIPK